MENEIYIFLTENAVGKNKRIKGKRLMRLFNINSDKTLRKYIQNINASKDYKLLIGAVSGQDGGYFVPESWEEIAKIIDNRKHRANQMLRECHIMTWKANL